MIRYFVYNNRNAKNYRMLPHHYRIFYQHLCDLYSGHLKTSILLNQHIWSAHKERCCDTLTHNGLLFIFQLPAHLKKLYYATHCLHVTKVQRALAYYFTRSMKFMKLRKNRTQFMYSGFKLQIPHSDCKAIMDSFGVTVIFLFLNFLCPISL